MISKRTKVTLGIAFTAVTTVAALAVDYTNVKAETARANWRAGKLERKVELVYKVCTDLQIVKEALGRGGKASDCGIEPKED